MMANLFFCAILLAWLVGASFTLTVGMSSLIFWFDSRYLELNLVSDRSLVQVERGFHQVLAYLTTPGSGSLKLTNFALSAAGRSHFQEVKIIFYVLFILTLISVCGLLFFGWRRQLRARLRINSTFLWNLIWLPIIIAVIASLDFDSFFIEFHRLLFRNTNWLFDPVTDPIIKILPDTFFLHCALVLLLWFGILWLGLWLYQKSSGDRKKDLKKHLTQF
ncbi:TIGR01906 family membrane protein [Lactobacillus sp. DCY120]|uniref:TIGR01906 family membrane protein n=1 Tax=Bombilactobacillus apium TaxID=2675299 RepID=A0A850R227_9LACO|nr:TIGR01906 family membrane protein [Bombilactobacillus apium]NVY97189.1 TIGR01906 family membrane protein [Bombilactobacillus apium]